MTWKATCLSFSVSDRQGEGKRVGKRHTQDIQSLDDGFVSELLVKHGQFDKVFSTAALHWCKLDPVGVIRSAKKVLGPGGTFAVEFGGWGNCAGRTNLHPWCDHI